jgi:hypothetical protein
LNQFNTNYAKEKKLVDFPPDFESTKCKAILFDLALGECEFPNLEARKKTKAGGGWLNFWRS